ncbi:hypothetical protein FB157_12539 [Streptomyces sp. BK340]|nr:hypothetical protein FB157_12539 [Streptomyces sp. BK340]
MCGARCAVCAAAVSRSGPDTGADPSNGSPGAHIEAHSLRQEGAAVCPATQPVDEPDRKSTVGRTALRIRVDSGGPSPPVLTAIAGPPPRRPSSRRPPCPNGSPWPRRRGRSSSLRDDQVGHVGAEPGGDSEGSARSRWGRLRLPGVAGLGHVGRRWPAAPMRVIACSYVTQGLDGSATAFVGRLLLSLLPAGADEEMHSRGLIHQALTPARSAPRHPRGRGARRSRRANRPKRTRPRPVRGARSGCDREIPATRPEGQPGNPVCVRCCVFFPMGPRAATAVCWKTRLGGAQ